LIKSYVLKMVIVVANYFSRVVNLGVSKDSN